MSTISEKAFQVLARKYSTADPGLLQNIVDQVSPTSEADIPLLEKKVQDILQIQPEEDTMKSAQDYTPPAQPPRHVDVTPPKQPSPSCPVPQTQRTAGVVPERIARWIKVEVLGRGQFGEVFKVYLKEKPNEFFAMKLQKLGRRPELVALHLREVELMKGISHTNLVRFHDAVQIDSDLFIIMDYCAGGCLTRAVQTSMKTTNQPGLPEYLVLRFISQITDALYELYLRNIVHRDLKPDNILLTSTNLCKASIKICDFGFSREQTDKSVTVVGTPLYLAPEVIQGVPYDGRLADIYSTGGVLYFMVSGNAPFRQARHFNQIPEMAKEGKGRPLPPGHRIPQCIVTAISRMMEYDIQKRWDINQLRESEMITEAKKYESEYLVPRDKTAEEEEESARLLIEEDERNERLQFLQGLRGACPNQCLPSGTHSLSTYDIAKSNPDSSSIMRDEVVSMAVDVSESQILVVTRSGYRVYCMADGTLVLTECVGLGSGIGIGEIIAGRRAVALGADPKERYSIIDRGAFVVAPFGAPVSAGAKYQCFGDVLSLTSRGAFLVCLSTTSRITIFSRAANSPSLDYFQINSIIADSSPSRVSVGVRPDGSGVVMWPDKDGAAGMVVVDRYTRDTKEQGAPFHRNALEQLKRRNIKEGVVSKKLDVTRVHFAGFAYLSLLLVSSDGKWVAGCDAGARTVQVYNLYDLQPRPAFTFHRGSRDSPACTMAFSKGNEYLAMSSVLDGRTVHVWTLGSSGQSAGLGQVHKAPSHSIVAWSKHRPTLLCVSASINKVLFVDAEKLDKRLPSDLTVGKEFDISGTKRDANTSINFERLVKKAPHTREDYTFKCCEAVFEARDTTPLPAAVVATTSEIIVLPWDSSRSRIALPFELFTSITRNGDTLELGLLGRNQRVSIRFTSEREVTFLERNGAHWRDTARQNASLERMVSFLCAQKHYGAKHRCSILDERPLIRLLHEYLGKTPWPIIPPCVFASIEPQPTGWFPRLFG